MGQRRYVQNLQAFVIDHERVAELHSYALRRSECDFRFHFRREWISIFTTTRPRLTQNVRIMSAMVMRRAPFKIPPGLKAPARFQEIVRGFPSSSVRTPGVLLFRFGSPMITRPSSRSVT